MQHDKYLYEKKAYEDGFRVIAGVDEVGRGCLCGPVVACVVIFEFGKYPVGMEDSKLLSPQKREELCLIIKDNCLDYSLGFVDHQDIDLYNIRQATFMAMKKAISGLKIKPDFVLVDGHPIPDFALPQCAIVKGDHLSGTIAAASIVAKVTRDSFIKECHEKYPLYGFDKNKGYGTKDHMDAIKKYGPCEIHRKSFEPIKSMLTGKLQGEFVFERETSFSR